MTNPETNVQEAPKSKYETMRDALLKSGFLIFGQQQAPNELEQLATEMSAVDWSAKAPASFGGIIVARTKSDTPETRIIAYPDKATALADPIVAETMYQRFVRLILKAARNAESQESQFVTVAGALGVPFDRDAYKFQAKKWVRALKELGLRQIGPRSLETALKSAAFATSIFPAFKEWDKLIGLMSAHAEQHGRSAAIFAHWAATRANVVVEQKEVTLGDTESINALIAKMEAEEEDDDDTEE